MKTLIILALLLTYSLGAQSAVVDEWYRVQFNSVNGAKNTTTCKNHPFFGGCQTAAGEHRFLVSDTWKPSGSTHQWITFWIRSEGYFSNLGTMGHLAAGLWANPVDGVPPDARGMALGTIGGGNPGGCATEGLSGPRLQHESFWATGNYLFFPSCTPFEFAENTWYGIAMRVNENGWIATEVYDQNLNLVHYWHSLDTFNPSNLQNQTGYFLAQTSDTGGTWSLVVEELSVGWY